MGCVCATWRPVIAGGRVTSKDAGVGKGGYRPRRGVKPQGHPRRVRGGTHGQYARAATHHQAGNATSCETHGYVAMFRMACFGA